MQRLYRSIDKIAAIVDDKAILSIMAIIAERGVAMEKTVSVAEAKNKLSDLLNRVAYHHERIIVSKRGKPVGAIVSAEDLQRLEEMEDRERVKRVRALKKTTKKYIPFEQVVRDHEKKWGVDLGLDFSKGSNVRR